VKAFFDFNLCCCLTISSGFGKWMRNTPLSNFASTLAGSNFRASPKPMSTRPDVPRMSVLPPQPAYFDLNQSAMPPVALNKIKK
jgi:hypothetical protein